MRLLLISGSLRKGSTNTAALRTLQAITPAGVDATIYDGMAALPLFHPDQDRDGEPVEPTVADLRAAIRAADALVISTPEYAGALPAALKNLLEWTVGDGCAYGEPVAWLNIAGPAAPARAADAHASPAKVLRYVGADVVSAAWARIPVLRADVGPDGLVGDRCIRDALGPTVAVLAEHVAAGPGERPGTGADRAAGAPVDQHAAVEFAAEWERNWNAHDLDALLAHFAEDVVFTSPVAAQLLPDGDGVIRGREALRSYWSYALGLLPDLHFTVENVYSGLDAIAITYRNHAGNRVCELLRFDGALVITGHATYLSDAAAAASGLPPDAAARHAA
jgi:NAD(P)H-dependent FMN reductase/ketosteroid isomerase-like protein